MLDQNTDRMWYVIGAVIVGAALIFLVNSSFPQLFASVGTTFKDKTEEVSETIDSISNTKIKNGSLSSKTLRFREASINPTFDDALQTWTFQAAHTGSLLMFDFSNGHTVYVPYDESLTISYDIYAESAIKTWNDANNYPVDAKGNDITAWNGNDNDGGPYRKMSVTVNIPAKVWTTVHINYTNQSSRNTAKATLRDGSLIGIVNDSTDPVTIKVRNVQSVKGRE